MLRKFDEIDVLEAVLEVKRSKVSVKQETHLVFWFLFLPKTVISPNENKIRALVETWLKYDRMCDVKSRRFYYVLILSTVGDIHNSHSESSLECLFSR